MRLPPSPLPARALCWLAPPLLLLMLQKQGPSKGLAGIGGLEVLILGMSGLRPSGLLPLGLHEPGPASICLLMRIYHQPNDRCPWVRRVGHCRVYCHRLSFSHWFSHLPGCCNGEPWVGGWSEGEPMNAVPCGHSAGEPPAPSSLDSRVQPDGLKMGHGNVHLCFG